MSNGIWPRLFEIVSAPFPELCNSRRCEHCARFHQADKFGPKAIASGGGQFMQKSKGIHSTALSMATPSLFGSFRVMTFNAAARTMFRRFCPGI
ncbi:hypothetical protein NKH57_24345 [Mesorhizobium sp. M1050]|uniref:hypothetical protein n=1 Tax=unclassified Mesorhizobium TaxID=325217 RepID=UPI003339583E